MVIDLLSLPNYKGVNFNFSLDNYVKCAALLLSAFWLYFTR